jgi:hypothetical protein
MSRNYKLVLLEDAAPGMELSDNLLDRHGKILLPQETVLNDKLLESLRRYDIDMIPVYSDELTEGQRAALVLERQERLEKLFRKRNYDKPSENANDVLLDYLRSFRQEDPE